MFASHLEWQLIRPNRIIGPLPRWVKTRISTGQSKREMPGLNISDTGVLFPISSHGHWEPLLSNHSASERISTNIPIGEMFSKQA